MNQVSNSEYVRHLWLLLLRYLPCLLQLLLHRLVLLLLRILNRLQFSRLLGFDCRLKVENSGHRSRAIETYQARANAMGTVPHAHARA